MCGLIDIHALSRSRASLPLRDVVHAFSDRAQPVPVELGKRLLETQASGGWLVLISGGLGAEELVAENPVGPSLELFDRPAAFAHKDDERLGSMQPVHDVGGPVYGQVLS